MRYLLVFMLLVAGSFVTYYYGIADYPRRDHGGYLAERVLVETDWDWFWHSVSFSRTRFLYPGDHYLFRPLHMAVLALKDIFFRNNLLALGAINIITMAVAAFSLYFFSSRLLKPALAFIVALLFMVQYPGLEMVTWGHISSYLLALAFFGFAMTSLLEAGPDNKAALKKAGVFLLLGTLVHEMVAVALVLAAPFLLFIRWRAGKGAEIGGLPLRLYLSWVIAVPLIVYLGLDLFDYLYHGAPSLFGAGSDSASGETPGPLGAIFTVVGSSAVAFLAPFKVEMTESKYRTLAWNFENMRPLIVAAGLVFSLATVAGLYRCIRAIKTGEGLRLSLPFLLIMLLFAGVVLGVGIGRVYTRGEYYFHEATYYYSITAYIFCLLIALGLYRLRKADKNKISLFLSRVTIVAMVLLVSVNFVKTREALGRNWPAGKFLTKMYPVIDRSLEENSDRYCLAGILPRNVDIYMRLYPQLFLRQMCQEKDGRIPGYLVVSSDGSLWFSELKEYHPDIFSEPQEVHFGSPMSNFLLSRESFDKPDIALTVHNKAHVLLIFGHQNIENYFYVELLGPILYCRAVTGGKLIHLSRYTALPYVKSNQRLKVRHGANFIYIFVDGHLVTTMPSARENPGKVGIIVKDTDVDIEKAFSDFVVANSVPPGTDPVEFKPVAKLLEGSEVAFSSMTDTLRNNGASADQ